MTMPIRYTYYLGNCERASRVSQLPIISKSGNRYMDKGFHRQKIKAKTVSGALKYVMTYDYEKGHPKDEQFLEVFEKTMEDVMTRQLNKELEEEAI